MWLPVPAARGPEMGVTSEGERTARRAPPSRGQSSTRAWLGLGLRLGLGIGLV